MITPKPQYIVSKKTKTTRSDIPTTGTTATTKSPQTPVTHSKQNMQIADSPFVESIKRLQSKQEELHNQQGSYDIKPNTHTTQSETKTFVIHTVTSTTTTPPLTTRNKDGGLLPMWGRRRKASKSSKSTTTSSTSQTTTSAKTSKTTSVATAASNTSPSNSESRTSTRALKTTSRPTAFSTSPHKSNSRTTTGKTESIYPSTEEYKTPEIPPLEDNPFINYFVILPPVDEMETNGTTKESDTSKFTTLPSERPSELVSNDQTSEPATSTSEKSSGHTSTVRKIDNDYFEVSFNPNDFESDKQEINGVNFSENVRNWKIGVCFTS